MIGRGNLKVLDYSNESARIYSFDKYGGAELRYSKRNDLWQFESWGAIWSTSGSADEFVFPYMHHSATGIALLAIFGIPAILIAIITLYIGSKCKTKSVN